MSEKDFKTQIALAKQKAIQLLDRTMLMATIDGEIIRERLLDIINEELLELERSPETQETRADLNVIILNREQLEQLING